VRREQNVIHREKAFRIVAALEFDRFFRARREFDLGAAAPIDHQLDSMIAFRHEKIGGFAAPDFVFFLVVNENPVSTRSVGKLLYSMNFDERHDYFLVRLPGLTASMPCAQSGQSSGL
jgi:hypothetical protein